MSRKQPSPRVVVKPVQATIADALISHVSNLENPLTGLANPSWADSLGLDDLEEIGVLAGLNAEQQQSLKALIRKLWEVEQVVPWTQPHRRERRRWEKHRNDYVNQIVRRSRTALSAIQSLQKYLKKVGVDWNPAHPSIQILTQAVSVLDPEALKLACDRLKADTPTPAGQTRTDVMRRLFEFFMSDCQLKEKNEAEVRVAKIGNRYWDWQVALIEKPRSLSDDRKGCEAVRKAVERARRRASDKPLTKR